MKPLLNRSGAPVSTGGQVGFCIPDDARVDALCFDAETWADSGLHILLTAAEDQDASPESLRESIGAACHLVAMAKAAVHAAFVIDQRNFLAQEARQ